jgi:LmbE family N-acetylglucosaminyl deacetylase
MKVRRFLLVLLPFLAAASLPAAETPVDLGDGDRVLVLSVHPGDEILSCAGLLQEAQDLELPVQVACMTVGGADEFFAYFIPGRKPRSAPLSRQLRETSERRSCALDAAEALGLSDDAYVFFGYPSGSLMTLWREVWRDAPGWVSPGGRAQTQTFDVRTPSAPFTAPAVLADVEGAFRDFAPTHLFIPSPLEASEDHRAAYAFARAALLDLAREGLAPHVHTYFTHAADWPAARAEGAAGPLDPPEGEADRIADEADAPVATLRLAPFQRERAEKARAALALPAAELCARYAASDERFPAAPEAAALPLVQSAYGETRYGASEAFLALAGATEDEIASRDEARALTEKTANAFIALEAADEGEATRITLRLARPKAAGVEVRLCAHAARDGVPFAESAHETFRTYDADQPEDPRTFTFRIARQPGEIALVVTAELIGAHDLPLDDFPPVVLATGASALQPVPESAETESVTEESAEDDEMEPWVEPERAPAPAKETVKAEKEVKKPGKESKQPAKKAEKKAEKPAPRSTSAADRPMAW